MKTCALALLVVSILVSVAPAKADDTPDPNLRVSYSDPAHSSVLLEMNGKQYIVDVASHSVREAGSSSAPQSPAADLFRQNCAQCHGVDGKGVRGKGTPDFASASTQAALNDKQIVDTIRNGKGSMPAWSGKLSDSQITALSSYIRSFANGSSTSGTAPQQIATAGVYQAGDDVLMSLPTGRAVDEHGLYVNFTHRFAYDSAVSGTGRGQELFGLDNFALSSFGFRYGVTDKLSVDVWRSPSFIDRPIQLMAAYNLMDEHHEAPFNLVVRVSIEGQNNFRKNYTENIEGIFSRSITSRAQFYVVPTMSFNDRRLVQGSLQSNLIQDLPGINAFSTGFGLAVDVRPTVALVAEVIPTFMNGTELGIHRPAFSFGIQKKILRHAFTLGFTNSPGTTVSQRAGTEATFLGKPGADTPSSLMLGFDLTRQIH